MSKLNASQIRRIHDLQAEVQVYGTPEMGYTDSGLWKFLKHVKTKDSHDHDNPVKRLMADSAVYMIVVFLYMLACPVLAIPKSRQIRMSWMSCAFAIWHTMSGKYRHTVYQTKKEEDAFAQTTQGAKNPADGRMDFIIQHLPGWLSDPNVVSGRGNQVGVLTFSQADMSSEGVRIPWKGSKINAIPQGAHQIRQYTPSLIVSDESAFQEEYGPSMVAAKPAVTGGGRIISVSSVDAGSAFNQMVLESPSGEPEWGEIHPDVQRGLDLLGIEWPKGLRSRRTPSGTWVLEVHYSADPAKDPERDGAAWIADAVKGYVGGFESTGWKTEMEIDYNAGGGEPVFPFLTPDSPIFVPEIPVDEALSRFRFYAGFDYGSVNPSHFGVWGVEPSGTAYKVWELHEPCVNLGDFVARMKRCPYWGRLEYKVCDWSMMNKTQRNRDGDLVTIHEQFEEHGVHFVRGKRGADIPHILRLKSEYWSDPTSPKAYITAACPHTRQEYANLRWAEHASQAVELRSNKKEKVRDKDNHSFDADAMLFDTEPSGHVEKERKIDWNSRPLTMDSMFKEMEARDLASQIRTGGISVM